MSFRVSTSVRDALAMRFAELLCNAGDSVFTIRSGTQPATADTAASGTLLFSIQTPTGMAYPVNGVVALGGQSGPAAATGVCGYVRWGGPTDGSMDCTCGTSGKDLLVDAASTSIGQTVSVDVLSVTQPVT